MHGYAVSMSYVQRQTPGAEAASGDSKRQLESTKNQKLTKQNIGTVIGFFYASHGVGDT